MSENLQQLSYDNQVEIRHGNVILSDMENEICVLPCDLATIVNWALAHGIIECAPTGNFQHITEPTG